MLFSRRKRSIKRILIVEDEPLTAFDNENMLGDLGYEIVATLDDFSDAVAVLEKEDVDLILSDVRLRSVETGVDLAREAKLRGIPTLFATGQACEGANEFAVGCLLKPYSDRQLKAAIDCVDKHLQRQKLKSLPKGLELYPHPDSDDDSNKA